MFKPTQPQLLNTEYTAIQALQDLDRKDDPQYERFVIYLKSIFPPDPVNLSKEESLNRLRTNLKWMIN